MTLNWTHPKEELLDHFQKYNIQEQSEGMHIIQLFPEPEGMQELLQMPAFSLSANQKLCYWSLLLNLFVMKSSRQKQINFEGHFPTDCQKDSVPYSHANGSEK